MVSLAGEKRKMPEVESLGVPPLQSSSEKCSSNNAGDDDKNGGGDKRDEDPNRAPAPAPARPRHHPTSSAAAYTDYSAVPEPCKIEDVLDINSKSDSPQERRQLNEDSILRRGGGAPKSADGGAEGSSKKDGSGGKGDNRRGPCPQATFPAKLHDILSRPDLGDVISWLDHGRAWHIIDQSAFVNRVMPHYFTQSKFASFMRQVNGWGFVRVTRGDEANSYYSEFFLRGKRSLARFMERKPAIRDLLGPEPNFAEYEDLPPNPEVDPASLLPLTPVEPTRTAAANKTKGEKRRRGPKDEKRHSGAAGGSAKERVNGVETALHRAILPHPTSLGGPGTAAATLNRATALQPVPYFRQQNVSGQPYPSQQYLSSPPPQTVTQQQTSFQRRQVQQHQQQAAVLAPSMPQVVPHTPAQGASGAMMMTPNAQSSPMVINQGYSQQQPMHPGSYTTGSPMVLTSSVPQQVSQGFPGVAGGNSGLPMQLHQQQQQHHSTNAVPQQVPQGFPRIAGGNGALPMQLHQQQQQGTTFHPAQSMMAANSSGVTAVTSQQQSHQGQAQFNMGQSPLTQSGQQATLPTNMHQQQPLMQQQMEGLMQMHIQPPHALQQQQQQQQQHQQLNQHPVSSNITPQMGPTHMAANPMQHFPNGATQGHPPYQQNVAGAPSLAALGPAAVPAPLASDLPQQRTLGSSPVLASSTAVPSQVHMPAPFEALVGKGMAGVAGVDRSASEGVDVSSNPSSPAFLGNDSGSAAKLKSPQDKDAIGSAFGGNDEAGDAIGRILSGQDGDAESIGTGGSMEMEDMDISGMIPITLARNMGSAGSLGVDSEDEGLMDGSLDNIW